MKKKLVVPIVIILALSLCCCIHTKKAPQTGHTDTAMDVFAPIDIGTPAPVTAGTETQMNSETQTQTEPAPESEPEPEPEPVIVEGRFTLADIIENGRTLDLYGIEMTPELAALEEALNAYDGAISFVSYDVTGEAAMAYNTGRTYCSHCTVKAGYMLYCYKKIETGAVRADEKLTYHQSHHTTGAGIVQNDPVGTKYPIERLLSLCLSISDNTAYKMLIERFGKSSYNDYMRSLGADSLVLSERTMWANWTKPTDLAKVWLEIYRYFTRGSDTALMMKANCTGTPYCYITEAIPELKYSHKSGEYYNDPTGVHDVAIVWNERPYIICVMSDSDGTNYEEIFRTIITTVNGVFTGQGTFPATSVW